MICAVAIALLFKYFEKVGISLLPVLFWNYIFCFLIAFIIWIRQVPPPSYEIQAWALYAVVLGILFVGGFFVMGKTIQYYGVVVGSVTQKMSLIVSASFGILFFSEPLSAAKLIGVLLALVAVVLINIPGNDTRKFRYLLLAAFALFPILNLLIAGTIESMLHLVEVFVFGDQAGTFRILFLMGIFLNAAVIAAAWSVIQLKGAGPLFSRPFILSGLVLGIPNFFSAFFILLALGSGIDGSLVFPVLNVGVILLSAVFAVLLFRESIGKYRMLGLIIAVIAILILASQS